MDHDGQLQIVVEPSAAGILVHVTGPLDAASTAVLEHELIAVLREAPGDVTIDLADVTFVGACGVDALDRSRELLATSGRSMNIRHPSIAVVRALRILGAAGVTDLAEHVTTP
jgi:anti-sigma B factor antagonist